LEDPYLELDLETAAAAGTGMKMQKLWRPFDGMHFLLTVRPAVDVPQSGTLLPSTSAGADEARKSGRVA
jgi:hypothetical protein